jgi:hypothetical protein
MNNVVWRKAPHEPNYDGCGFVDIDNTEMILLESAAGEAIMAWYGQPEWDAPEWNQPPVFEWKCVHNGELFKIKSGYMAVCLLKADPPLAGERAVGDWYFVKESAVQGAE